MFITNNKHNNASSGIHLKKILIIVLKLAFLIQNKSILLKFSALKELYVLHILTIGEFLARIVVVRRLGKTNKLVIGCRSHGGRNSTLNFTFPNKSESVIFPLIVPYRKFVSSLYIKLL